MEELEKDQKEIYKKIKIIWSNDKKYQKAILIYPNCGLNNRFINKKNEEFTYRILPKLNLNYLKSIKNYQMKPNELNPIDQKTIKAIKSDVGKDNLKDFFMTSVEDVVNAINYWTLRLQNASVDGQLTIQNEISSLEGILLKKSKITQCVYQTALDDILRANLDSIESPQKTTDTQSREDKEVDIANRLRDSNKSPAKEKSKPITMKIDIYRNHVITKFQNLNSDPKTNKKLITELHKETINNLVSTPPDTVRVIYDNNDLVNFSKSAAKSWLEKVITEAKTKTETPTDSASFSFKETPTLRELAIKCKELIVDNNLENAKELAKKHLLEADYVPKKEKQEPRKWGQSEFNKWFATITTNAKTTPSEKKEEIIPPTKDEETFDPMKIEGFDKTANTLIEEKEAFNNLANRIYKLEELHEKNENAESATEQHNHGLRKNNLYTVFFKNRSYNKEEIEKLKTYFLSSDASMEFDPFFIMKGELKNDSITVKDIKANIEKDKEEGTDYSSTLEFYLGQLVGTIVKDKDNVEHELYTPLHVKELIKILYDEVTAKALANLEDSTQTHKHPTNDWGKPAATASEDVQPVSTEKETVAKEKKQAPITRDEVKKIILAMVKYGGIKEDLPNNSKFNAMFGREIAINSKDTSIFHKFEQMKSFLEEVFDEAKKEYDNKRTTYPLQTFLKLVWKYAESKKTEEEFLNDNLFLIAKDDNTFLELQSEIANESDKPNIEFTSLDDVKKYIHGIYETQKKAKESKERNVSKEHEELAKEQEVETKKDDTPVKTEEELINTINEDTIKREEKRASFKEPTFTSFNEIKPLGIELIKEQGYTREDIDKWLIRNILNKQLKEQKDKDSIITREDTVRAIGNTFKEFFDGISASSDEEFIDKTIIENLKNAESMSSVVTAVRTAIKEAEETGTDFTKTYGITELFKRTIETAEKLNPDLYKKYMANKKDKENLEKSTPEKKDVFIPEEIRITDPDLWDKHKDSTHLNQLDAASTKLCKEGNWQKALSLCLQVIPQSNIETAKDWDEKTIVNWFNKDIAAKGKTENTETEKEQPVKKKDLSKANGNDNQFGDVQSANSKGIFKKALGELLKKNSSSPDFHKDIIKAIKEKNISGRYTRQLARNPESDVLNIIRKTKKNVEKFN